MYSFCSFLFTVSYIYWLTKIFKRSLKQNSNFGTEPNDLNSFERSEGSVDLITCNKILNKSQLFKIAKKIVKVEKSHSILKGVRIFSRITINPI